MILGKDDSLITQVANQIIPIASPRSIIVYNKKYDMDGSLDSFKLCLVGDFPDRRRLLSQIFDIDCEVPFDILLYSPEQFDQLKEDAGAFANRVYRKGKIIYGR